MNTESRLAPNPKMTSRTPHRKVLLLDDDENFNDALTDYLSSHRYDVVKAYNGVEGVREVMDSDFDVIICDMMMPKLAGDMFYIAVQRIKPYLNRRFIFITGHPTNPEISDFLRKNEPILFEKPFKLDLLIEAIESFEDEPHGKN
jgi:DNA-binding NtrC family response regulator